MYLCHDHDTGSELAVKQVEVGLLNTATQKVHALYLLEDYDEMNVCDSLPCRGKAIIYIIAVYVSGS